MHGRFVGSYDLGCEHPLDWVIRFDAPQPLQTGSCGLGKIGRVEGWQSPSHPIRNATIPAVIVIAPAECLVP